MTTLPTQHQIRPEWKPGQITFQWFDSISCVTGCLFYQFFFIDRLPFLSKLVLFGRVPFFIWTFLFDRVPGWGNTSSMEFISKSSWGFATYFSPIVEVLRWNWNIIGAWYKNLLQKVIFRIKFLFVRVWWRLVMFAGTHFWVHRMTFEKQQMNKVNKRTKTDSNSSNRWILRKA